MTDPAMSPAQKIRKALAERYCCEPDDIPTSMCEMESVACIVLRAAADLEKESPWRKRVESIGGRWMRDKLLAIAAELEAQP